MSKYTLPFYSDFFHILLNYEIIEWRANDFIKAIFNDRQFVKLSEKQSRLLDFTILRNP
jgi:hypothetical protein